MECYAEAIWNRLMFIAQALGGIYIKVSRARSTSSFSAGGLP
jgi:hypothetical protein